MYTTTSSMFCIKKSIDEYFLYIFYWQPLHKISLQDPSNYNGWVSEYNEWEYFIWRPPHNLSGSCQIIKWRLLHNLSRGHHIINIRTPSYPFMWRPPLKLSGSRYLIIWRPPLKLCGGRQINKWRLLHKIFSLQSVPWHERSSIQYSILVILTFLK